MSGGIAKGRLSEERKAWRKDHPIGFFAKPVSNGDGSTNMFKWTAGIPGKPNTDWEGGVYQVTMEFSEEYPSRPPKCTYRRSSSYCISFPDAIVILFHLYLLFAN